MVKEKVEAPQGSVWLLMHPRHTILVTSIEKNGNANIITLAWSMITSFDPTMIAISVGPSRFSHDLIREVGEFVVNVPGMDLVKETLFCGRHTGKNTDKFKVTGLTPIAARKVKPPLIKECYANLECRVVKEMVTGDHTLFVGEVVSAVVDEGIFNKGFNTELIRPVLHNGHDDFVTIDPEIITPTR